MCLSLARGCNEAEALLVTSSHYIPSNAYARLCESDHIYMHIHARYKQSSSKNLNMLCSLQSGNFKVVLFVKEVPHQISVLDVPLYNQPYMIMLGHSMPKIYGPIVFGVILCAPMFRGP
jgi:hypothetical protein